ncbi:MAG TPA: YciI family protein [Thermomicrobiales bacterium]|nr:YciI family protein [Thermomicrobiales bacterium]
MPLFAAILEYSDDAERRQQVRPTHREYLRSILEAGKLHESGPLADDSGAIIVYDVADLSEAQEILANDPFAQEGVIAGAQLQQWNIVMSKNGQ